MIPDLYSVVKRSRVMAGRLHLNGFGLEADQLAQVVLVPGGRQPLVGDAHPGARSCRSRLWAMRLRMAMLWAA